jgi:GNAT superfamily N-acetyltransferase
MRRRRRIVCDDEEAHIPTSAQVKGASLEYRELHAGEKPAMSHFFRDAGFPVALLPNDRGWGAWSRDKLVGCIALCHEANTWVLRGPEVLPGFQKRGTGARLLELIQPELAGHSWYCVAYPYLKAMYAKAGFAPCPPDQQPRFLAKRVAWLRQTGWDLLILKKP